MIEKTEIDRVLVNLFNLVALNPLGVKQIYLPSSNLIDCRSINTTVNNGGSRIPHERSIVADSVLRKCYESLDQMEAMFFLYGYANENKWLPQLVTGVSILSGVDKAIVGHSIIGYRDGMQSVIELANKLDIEYNRAQNQSAKVRKECAKLHQSINDTVEHILIDNNLIERE